MVKKLPIVKVNGVDYFLDERLRELREVSNPNSRIICEKYEFVLDKFRAGKTEITFEVFCVPFKRIEYGIEFVIAEQKSDILDGTSTVIDEEVNDSEMDMEDENKLEDIKSYKELYGKEYGKNKEIFQG